MRVVSERLKSCPFCGEPPETEPVGERRAGLMIECVNPRCAVQPHVSYYEHAVAIDGWNRRAPTSRREDATDEQ